MVRLKCAGLDATSITSPIEWSATDAMHPGTLIVADLPIHRRVPDPCGNCNHLYNQNQNNFIMLYIYIALCLCMQNIIDSYMH